MFKLMSCGACGAERRKSVGLRKSGGRWIERPAVQPLALALRRVCFRDRDGNTVAGCAVPAGPRLAGVFAGACHQGPVLVAGEVAGGEAADGEAAGGEAAGGEAASGEAAGGEAASGEAVGGEGGSGGGDGAVSGFVAGGWVGAVVAGFTVMGWGPVPVGSSDAGSFSSWFEAGGMAGVMLPCPFSSSGMAAPPSASSVLQCPAPS